MKTENISFSYTEKMGLIMSFSTMLSAGITIMDAINSLLEDSKGNLKKVLFILKNDVSQGKRAYQSFEKFPLIFDKVTTNIIKAAEEAGTLDTTLRSVNENIRKEMEFTNKIKAALMYPFFIVMVFIGVLFMILIVVMPKISTVFSRLRVPLPLTTKILIFLSNTMLQYTVHCIIGAALIIGFIFFMYKKNKKLMLRIAFSFPIINGLVKKIDLTRFSRSMYMLLKSGITITNALDLTQDVVLNKDINRLIINAKTTVLSGKRFSEGLKDRKKIVPTMMIKLIEVGEKSGSLEQSLSNVSDYLDYEVSESLKTATALLEPVMLVAVGIMVGAMMLAIIGPIYGLIGQVGAK